MYDLGIFVSVCIYCVNIKNAGASLAGDVAVRFALMDQLSAN